MDTQFDLQILPGHPTPFGATESKQGINFAIYIKDAIQVSLCFFDEHELEAPLKEIPLNPSIHKTGSVWHCLIEGLPPFITYGYQVQPANQQDNIRYLLLDPYAKSLTSNPKWAEPIDQDRVYRPLGKTTMGHEFDWQGTTFPHIPFQDLIIYEMHVRGFTADTSSKVERPGTYLGLVEKIPYLKELGINAVELMPIHEFNEKEAMQVNPYTKHKLVNYFGYSTVNFFCPMIRYSSSTEKDQVLTEFKTMVRELHKNGIEVILDVVYNHTFEGNHMGPTLSFRGLDARGYYMINPQGDYLNFSGCGNTFNANHPVTRELILESLRYWVTEMHIDGFRFDLASILTRAENGAPLGNAPIVEAITLDPILSETKLIAEAWDAGGLYQVGGFVPANSRWSEWNGKYRDVSRRFIKGMPGNKNAFATVVCGSQDLYGHKQRATCSINFVTAHDGFTLADLVSYNEKHNLDNGEDNRDGFDHNDSWNCGFEGHSGNKKVIYLRERQIRNFHLALMVSFGVPMLLMGDEYSHSRNGNNNSWCQDNELNWFLWDRLESRQGFYRFYRSLIEFRKTYPLLRRETFLGQDDITWHGLNPLDPQWENDNRFIAFTLNIPGQGPDLYVAFNTAHIPLTVTLPIPRPGTSWHWIVNTHNPPPEDFLDEEHTKKVIAQTFRISSYSAIMLRALEDKDVHPF